MALSAMPPCSICMNATDEDFIRFSLGHFLGSTNAVMLFVENTPRSPPSVIDSYCQVIEVQIVKLWQSQVYATFCWWN